MRKMALIDPFHHQNTHVNITILVVDDDPIFLSIIPNMLKTPRYKDKSIGEITIVTAKDSSEAISMLRDQYNNIDIVISDYHMPGLNGVQLKKRIDEEFGKLPVIVISADMNNEIEQETLSSGAMEFMRKPIKPNDLNTLRNHALNHKMNGEFISIDDKDGRTDIDGSNKNPTNNSHGGDSRPRVTKMKSKLKWTSSLEHRFFQAIEFIGLHKAAPKKILEIMNMENLTRAHVASKLQKYRTNLKRVEDKGQMSSRAMTSNFASSGCNNPQDTYNCSTSLRKNNHFNSQLGFGLGQSSLMVNNDSTHYMNPRATSDSSQIGSNLFPMRSGFGFSNGILPLNEKMSSIFGTSQAPQVLRFGQYDTTNNVLGMDSNPITPNIRSTYAGNNIYENGELVGPGRVRVNGNGNSNSSLSENLGAMNWHFNNNNMSNHGSSTLRFPFAFEDQSHSNLIVQQENASVFNDHLGINEAFYDTINSQFDLDRNQHQGKVSGENHGMSTDDLLKRNATLSAYPLGDNSHWSFYNGKSNEETLNSIATNSEMYIPTGDMNIINQWKGNYNEETLKSIAANSEIYFPTDDMNITNHGNSDEEPLNSIVANSEMYALTGEMNIHRLKRNSNEEPLNSIAANSEMYFPTRDIDIRNQEHGVADLKDLPSLFDQDWDDEDFMNYLLDHDMN